MRGIGPFARRGLSLLCLLLAAPLAAAEPDADARLEDLRARLLRSVEGLRPADLRPAGVAGLYELQLGSSFAYITPDGRYLIGGDLVDLAEGVKLTEQRRRDWRRAQVQALSGQAIVYPAEGATRARLTVFTDLDCVYCRQWHQEVPRLNARGVEVRYLFFPRSGPQSASYRKAGEVWCADDPGDALTRALRDRRPRATRSGCVPPVEAQYRLAEELELSATPAMLLPDGQLLYGFRGVDALMGLLDQPP